MACARSAATTNRCRSLLGFPLLPGSKNRLDTVERIVGRARVPRPKVSQSPSPPRSKKASVRSTHRVDSGGHRFVSARNTASPSRQALLRPFARCEIEHPAAAYDSSRVSARTHRVADEPTDQSCTYTKVLDTGRMNHDCSASGLLARSRYRPSVSFGVWRRSAR